MRDPNPTVMLIPGLGMVAWGKNKSESRVTAEFYNCAIEVMRGAEAIDAYEAMDQQEAFDIEYWNLEEAKLRRLPPEKELDRQVIAVIGAGAGIGKAMAHRLVREGAHIVAVDRDASAAQATADEIIAKVRSGHRRGRHGYQQLWSGDRAGVRRHRPGQRATHVCRRDARVRRPGRSGRHRGHLRAAGQGRTRGRPDVGAHLWHQRHRRLHRCRRGASDLPAPGPARQHRADHQRERGRGQEGEPGIRHEQGGGKPPRARAGRGDGAARPRQRRGAGHGGEGEHDVPQGPRRGVAREVRDRIWRRRVDREPARPAGRLLRHTVAHGSPIEPRIRRRRFCCS